MAKRWYELLIIEMALIAAIAGSIVLVTDPLHPARNRTTLYDGIRSQSGLSISWSSWVFLPSKTPPSSQDRVLFSVESNVGPRHLAPSVFARKTNQLSVNLSTTISGNGYETFDGPNIPELDCWVFIAITITNGARRNITIYVSSGGASEIAQATFSLSGDMVLFKSATAHIPDPSSPIYLTELTYHSAALSLGAIRTLSATSPRSFVAQSGAQIGGTAFAMSQPINVTCPSQLVISSVDFASYGRPHGVFPRFTVNSTCNAGQSVSRLTSDCLGMRSCRLPISHDDYGLAAPMACGPAPMSLSVIMTCQMPPTTLLDVSANFTARSPTINHASGEIVNGYLVSIMLFPSQDQQTLSSQRYFTQDLASALNISPDLLASISLQDGPDSRSIILSLAILPNPPDSDGKDIATRFAAEMQKPNSAARAIPLLSTASQPPVAITIKSVRILSCSTYYIAVVTETEACANGDTMHSALNSVDDESLSGTLIAILVLATLIPTIVVVIVLLKCWRSHPIPGSEMNTNAKSPVLDTSDLINGPVGLGTDHRNPLTASFSNKFEIRSSYTPTSMGTNIIPRPYSVIDLPRGISSEVAQNLDIVKGFIPANLQQRYSVEDASRENVAKGAVLRSSQLHHGPWDVPLGPAHVDITAHQTMDDTISDDSMCEPQPLRLHRVRMMRLQHGARDKFGQGAITDSEDYTISD